MTEAARDKIAEKLRYLTDALTKLEPFRRLSEDEYQSDNRNQYSVERLFQTVLEATLDVARLIIIDQQLTKPTEARSEFAILADSGVLPVELAERLTNAKKFRNVLVHDYVSVDPEKVRQHLQHDIDDLKSFAQTVAAYLQKRSSR